MCECHCLNVVCEFLLFQASYTFVFQLHFINFLTLLFYFFVILRLLIANCRKHLGCMYFNVLNLLFYFQLLHFNFNVLLTLLVYIFYVNNELQTSLAHEFYCFKAFAFTFCSI